MTNYILQLRVKDMRHPCVLVRDDTANTVKRKGKKENS